VSTAGCPKCEGRWPDERYRVAAFPTSTAYLHDDQFFPGWTVLVLNRHATELWQLERDERAALIEEVTTVARVLAEELAPVKVNYELLGNQVAHVHWHVIPRLASDPVPKMPVWVHEHAPVVLSDAERVDRIERLRRRLGR
jgi:diadenosine tetraphosphate (Ap4A) HIT family hydrolase